MSQGDVEEIDAATCRRLLERHHFGRVAVVDDRGPIALPVNYVVDGDAVVWRSDPGTKLDAAKAGQPASFEIDDVDEDRRVGWSVVVRGEIREVTDDATVERLRESGLDPFVGGEKDHFLSIGLDEVSGRRVPLPESTPAEWFEAADLGNIWYDRDASDLLG